MSNIGLSPCHFFVRSWYLGSAHLINTFHYLPTTLLPTRTLLSPLSLFHCLCFSIWLLLRFFSLLLSNHTVPLHCLVYVYCIWSSLHCLDLWVYSFYQIWKFFFHYFFIYFFYTHLYLSLIFLVGTPITHVLAPLTLSQSSPMLRSFYFTFLKIVLID